MKHLVAVGDVYVHKIKHVSNKCVLCMQHNSHRVLAGGNVLVCIFLCYCFVCSVVLYIVGLGRVSLVKMFPLTETSLGKG